MRAWFRRIAPEAVTCYGLVPNRAWAHTRNQTSGLPPGRSRQVTSQRRRCPRKFMLYDLIYG